MNEEVTSVVFTDIRKGMILHSKKNKLLIGWSLQLHGHAVDAITFTDTQCTYYNQLIEPHITVAFIAKTIFWVFLGKIKL